MWFVNALLQTLAFAYVSEALVPCDTRTQSADHCRLPKRPTYVHLDQLGLTFTSAQVTQYIKDLVTAGSDYILLSRVLIADKELTGSAMRYSGLSNDERDDLKRFMKEKGAKLLMTIGGGPHGFDMESTSPVLVADHWCNRAQDLGFDGVNWDLDALTSSDIDNRQVDWYLEATRVCHFAGTVTYSVQGETLSATSPSPLEAIIAASKDAGDRFLLTFRDVRGPLAEMYNRDGKAISQLLTAIEQRIPGAKGKLVIGKVLFGSSCTRWVSPHALNEVLETVEKAGHFGGVVLSKAPSQGSRYMEYFLTTLLPQVSRSASADSSKSMDASTTPGEHMTTVYEEPPVDYLLKLKHILAQPRFANVSIPWWMMDVRTRRRQWSQRGHRRLFEYAPRQRSASISVHLSDGE